MSLVRHVRARAASDETHASVFDLRVRVFGEAPSDVPALIAAARERDSLYIYVTRANDQRICGAAIVETACPVWVLSALVVEPSARRRGVATRVLGVLADLCDRDQKSCDLTLSHAWFTGRDRGRITRIDDAQSLYAAVGFRVIRVRDGVATDMRRTPARCVPGA